MRRLWGACLLLASACSVRSPVHETLTVDLTRGRDMAGVVVTTDIDDTSGSDKPEKTARLAALRRDIVDARDEWSVRFASVEKASDRVVLENKRGALVHAERSAVVERSDLQRMLADTGLVMQFQRGEGWTELSLYANSSGRASREERERVMSVLNKWSEEVAEYFRTMDVLYKYLEREPSRAEPVFTELLDNEDVELTDKEHEMLDRASDRIRTLETLLTDAENRGISVDEQFDRVFNPFPAAFSVRVPAVVSYEGFTKREDTLVAERAGLLEAIFALEGKWLSPDPIAMIVRADSDGKDLPPAAQVAALPRKSSSTVTGQEIASTVLSILQRNTTYRVRFTER